MGVDHSRLMSCGPGGTGRECGTHALTAATMGACTTRGDHTGRDLLPALARAYSCWPTATVAVAVCLRVVHDRACRPWRCEFDRKQSSLVP